MHSHWKVVEEGFNVISDTPQSLWGNAKAYFLWCDEHPIEKVSKLSSGKDAGKDNVQKIIRPYTVKGMCLHCNISMEYLASIAQSKNKDSDYFVVVSKIMYIIQTQNIEMATVGEFNSVFVTRVLNMEKEEISNEPIRIEVVSGLPELSTSENQIIEKLELENQKEQLAKEQSGEIEKP